MPSITPKQARFMRAVSHDPAFAKKVGVPQKVGQDFEAADRNKAIVSQLRSGVGRKK